MEQPAAKSELVAAMRRVRDEWNRLLAEVGEARMSEPNVEGTWAVRDVIAHLSAYERWTAARVLADLDGQQPTNYDLYDRDDAPPDGDEGGVDAYNAWHVAFNRRRALREVLAANERAYQKMLAALERIDERDLTDRSASPGCPANRSGKFCPISRTIITECTCLRSAPG